MTLSQEEAAMVMAMRQEASEDEEAGHLKMLQMRGQVINADEQDPDEAPGDDADGPSEDIEAGADPNDPSEDGDADGGPGPDGSPDDAPPSLLQDGDKWFVAH